MRQSAWRGCHTGVEWTGDDPKQHEQKRLRKARTTHGMRAASYDATYANL